MLATRLDRQVDVEIVDQIAGMHPEETGQQQPGRTGEVGPRTPSELREIGLADPTSQLLAHTSGDFGLSELPPQPASHPFKETQFRQLLSKRHCNLQYMADCNSWQGSVSDKWLVVSLSAGGALLRVGVGNAFESTIRALRDCRPHRCPWVLATNHCR